MRIVVGEGDKQRKNGKGKMEKRVTEKEERRGRRIGKGKRKRKVIRDAKTEKKKKLAKLMCQ